MSNLVQVPNQTPAPRTEGITLSYKQISNDTLHAGLRRLDSFTGWKDTKDIWRYNKFADTFHREHKKAGLWYKKIIDKHAIKVEAKKKNEKGEMEVVKLPNGEPKMIPKWAPNPATGQMDIVMKDQAAFEKDMKELHSTTFTVKVLKFRAEDFLAAGLTPVELRACATLVEGIPDDLAIEGDDDEDEDLLLDDELANEEPPTTETTTDGGSSSPAST